MGEPVSTVMRIAMRIGLDAISNLAVKEPEAVIKALNSLHEREQVSSAKETAAARSIVDVAAAQSLGATNAPLSSAKPVNYKFARKSSKQKHSEHA